MSYDPNYTRIGFPRPTPMVGWLMIANGAVFVFNAVTVGRCEDWFAVSWSALFEGYGLGFLRLLSYQFTHSFRDLGHILWNVVFLYFFGGIVERSLFGHLGTLKVYLVGGLVGALLHMALYGAVLGEQVPVVGASGSCYALLLAAVCLQPRMVIRVLFFDFQLVLLGIFLVGAALYSTYVELVDGRTGFVSHGAHMGGALLGYAAWRLGWFRGYGSEMPGNPVHGLSRWLARRRARRAVASAEADQQQLDGLLEKIQKQGLTSLTAAERKALEKVSARQRERTQSR